ncbi:Wzz/FepE/Etk N-terminal domain-containing protein [Geomonas sp. RF6]|uniref:GumC family protein n=1 Tax=Geomonas sp. RF6 TaxID=2897342 RepID=UPI001E2F3F6A|nr:Wzz/FepE/Etk N-terminal domain-containing protein [Geomonas sp. RF6]UFS69270.1 Wzz/FepE/Etk N-terminal domain-containing protein [Geomonas sp. RF6]
MQETKQTIPEEGELNLLELVHVLARRRRIIITSCVAAALISAAVSFAMPKQYKATATVLPPQKEGASNLSALLGQASGLSGLTTGLFGSTSSTDLYVGILKSRSVADAVIAKLDLTNVFHARNREESRKRLSSVVKVQAGKDGIITINAEMESPKLAADLANAMVAELGKKSVQLNLTKAGGERVFLEKRLEVVKSDLKNAEEELKGFQQRNRSIKVEAQAVATIEGLAKVKAELVSREVQLASLSISRTAESPEVKSLEGSIARLRHQVAAMEGVGGLDAIPAVGNVPALAVEYARRMRNLKVQEAIYEQLTKQYEMAKLSEAKDSASLQVLDEAVPPLKKSKPVRSVIILASTFAAFILSALAAVLLEYVQLLPQEDRKRLEEIKVALLPWKGGCSS